MIPVLLRFLRDRSHRDALRSANGVNIGAERATELAWTVLFVVLALAVVAMLARG